jgi:pimeloyl-ACP methyl ester carboxylesterase
MATFIAVLEKIKAEYGKVIWVGWSGGATTGHQLVVARPDLFKAMVGLETPQCSTLPINGFDYISVKPQVPVDPAYVAAYANSKVPFLNVNSEAGHKTWAGHSREHCQPLVDAINTAGGKAYSAWLPDFGVRGNSHQMMSERNSDDVAKVVLNWIEAKVLKTNRGDWMHH